MIVSRKATCGAPVATSALNSRFMRSTYTSRCSSPIPAMMVSPVASSVAARKVGSSLVKRASALATFAEAFLSFGVIASLITGSGTCMLLMEHSVRPSVKVSPLAQSTPKSATMSPAWLRSMSSIWFACMRTSRPTLTRFPVRVLTMVSPLRSAPW